MANEYLAPCPFCGGKARLIHNPSIGYWYSCDNYCINTNGYWPTEADALAWWNRRTLPVVPDEVKKAIDTLCQVNEYHSAAIVLRRWLSTTEGSVI
jgi:hypothetical protein